MRRPSDAQATTLRLIAEFTGPVYWPRPVEERDASTSSRAVLWTEHEDRAASTSQFECLPYRDLPRTVTLAACLRHGWLSVEERVLASGARLVGVWLPGNSRRDPAVILRELLLTEDGTIALGCWREHKLTSPPPELPRLTDRDREIVALADQAIRLGFRLAPREDQARADARRLARQGWVRRGYVGAGVRTLVPSALGQVEVNPEHADEPPTAA